MDTITELTRKEHKTISDAWNRGTLDNVDSLIDADYTIHHYRNQPHMDQSCLNKHF